MMLDNKFQDIERRLDYTEELITKIKDEEYAIVKTLRNMSDRLTSYQIIISGILAICITFIILIFYVYL